MFPSRLTFLLPVKGRYLHALRLLWHSNRTEIPHRFLIADGGGHPDFAALLKRSAELFPRLDIEHVVYDDGGGFSDFYRRTAAAMRRVSTPYVMNCGDDDFILAAGLERCVEFLDQHPDYVCCGGGVAGLSLSMPPNSDRPPLTGTIVRLDFPINRHYVPRDIRHDRAVDRIAAGFGDYLSTYHHVFRTELLREIYSEIERCDFATLHLREAYQALRTLASGKAKTDPSVMHYMRQRRVGPAAGGDVIRKAFHPPFVQEFDRMMAQLAGLAAAADGIDAGAAEPRIRDAYAEFFRRKAAGSFKNGPLPQPNPGWLRSALRAVRGRTNDASTVVEQRRQLFARMAENGASDMYMKSLGREFDAVEDTLESRDFTDFLSAHAGALLAATSCGEERRPGLVAPS